MTNIPGPSQRYSGISDLRDLDQLAAETREQREIREAAAVAYRKAALSLKPPAPTKIPLDTANYDPHGHFDLVNGWYLVPATGLYLFSANIYVTLEVSIVYAVELRQNTGLVLVGDVNVTPVAQNYGIVVSGAFPCTEGDHIELYGFANAGKEAPLIIEEGESTNRLSAVRIT